MKILRSILVSALVAGVSMQMHAWGREGHRLVALVATSRLTPAAQAQVQQLLGRETLADVAPYPDDYRSDHPETGPWHYVDIPLNSKTYDRDRDCPKASRPSPDGQDWRDCATDRISYFYLRLKDRSLPVEDRKLALEMLVHLVGDLHQPLHAIGDDRGGNGVRVGFLGSEQCGERQRCNLHGVWDYSMIERRGLSEDKYLKALEGEIAAHNWNKVSQENPVVWSEQSHALAVQAWVPSNVMLNRDYYETEIQVVDRQIAVAGIRLARMLNAALRDTTPSPASAVK